MLVLCSFFWSGNFIVGKYASLFEVPPLTLNFLRWLIIWIILIPFTYKDIRFTTKGDVLYAIVLGWPEDGKVLIKSLAADSKLRPEPINRVDLCGGPSLQFERKAEGLEIKLATDKLATNYAFALRIS